MGIFLTVLPLAVGGAAAVLTMDAMAQYSALPQPPLAPPAWVFPAVWTVLYLLMGAASRRVHRLGTQESRNALMLYYVQLAVHFIWPLLYFRAQESLSRSGGCSCCSRSCLQRCRRFPASTKPQAGCSCRMRHGCCLRHISITA